MMISHYNGCCMLFPAARRLTRHLSSIRKKSCFTREEACRLPPRSLIEPRFNGQSDPYQADGGSPLPARRWHRTSRKENMPGVPSMGCGLKSVTAVKGHAGGGRAPLGERLLKPLETGFTYPALIPLPAWEKACRNTVRVLYFAQHPRDSFAFALKSMLYPHFLCVCTHRPSRNSVLVVHPQKGIDKPLRFWYSNWARLICACSSVG